jgi:hypothetical protein
VKLSKKKKKTHKRGYQTGHVKETCLVAHTCNPSYSESRYQEDCGSKPAWALNSGVDPEFKLYYRKNKNPQYNKEANFPFPCSTLVKNMCWATQNFYHFVQI